jgi:lipoprotein-releasing system permease protein
MRFELEVALRYLRSSRLQSALLLLGVAIGVLVFTFIAMLINGLRERLTEDVIGNLPHVTLEPREREPAYLGAGKGEPLVVRRLSTWKSREIRNHRAALQAIGGTRRVRAVSPEVTGNGFFVRGERIAGVAIVGVEPANVTAIANLRRGLRDGSLDLDVGDVLIGQSLADELDVEVGSRLVLRSERLRERVFTVRGIFSLGIEASDRRTAYVNIRAARFQLEVTNGVSRIAVKLDDPFRAATAADELARATGLDAKSWIEENERLRDALGSQAATGNLIKAFSLITVVIGVASALLLAAIRRRSEIGIMRSFGIRRRSVVSIFVLQGVIVGLVGSSLGAVLGRAFGALLLAIARRPDGTPVLPLDPAQGEYALAITLATCGSALAAVFPARAAAKVDPVEVISQ